MKTFLFVTAFSLNVFAAYAQKLPLWLSWRDDVEIRSAICGVTHAPVLRMTSITDHHPVPGAIPMTTEKIEIRDGKLALTPVIVYERTDRMCVATGSESDLSGKVFIVQRTSKGWEILSESFWIH